MSRWIRHGCIGICAVLVGITSVVVASPGDQADAAAPRPLDCANWRYGPADEPTSLPAEFDRNDYRRTSLRDPALADSPHNLCGQKGIAVDLAWGVTQGDADVLIAILDSGIRWRDAATMSDLAEKARINLGEAQPSCVTVHPEGDCNGDGTFDIRDFGTLSDRNGNGVVDPEDLILDPAFSNGVDDDGNGYVDDIAGWDFLYGDNNAFDTVDYGHGSGEAEDSVANSNGSRNVGTCPECQFVPVRVGDSFIADGQRFAAGVLFALDQGARVIQEALGVITNPSAAQQAIDAAYDRGVVTVASMADEASKHPNLSSSLEHTMTVNSVTHLQSGLLQDGPEVGYLALNGCTNFGGRTFVSVSSSSCSSEATGISAGVMGLLQSAADDAGVTLSANEAMQIVRATADDIDFSTPNAVDPANDFGTPSHNPIADTIRYPSRPGWDGTYGYGRMNAYEIVRAVEDQRIPPEAMIDSPAWFDVEAVSGTVPVTGRVAAPRADSYDYEVQWATGLQGPEYPRTDTWHTVRTRTGLTAPLDGTLAELDLAEVAAALPEGGHGTPTDADDRNRPDEEKYSVRIRVVVHAHGGVSDGLDGEMQKQVFVHDDGDLVAGYPRRVAGAGSSSARFVDIDGDGANELLVATSDGQIHAYESDGSELAGFPVSGDPSPFWPTGSATGAADGINVPAGAFVLGAPAVGDLDGDGQAEIVDADLNGSVYVWSSTGRRLATMHSNPAFSQDSASSQDQFNRTQPGFFSSPTLGDLDGDGTLEIVAAGMDRHVYAWHADGSPVDGFPVLVVDPDTVEAVDPVTHHVTFEAGANAKEGGSLTATPTLADLDGDGLDDIIVGAQEEYAEPVNIGGDGRDMVTLLQQVSDLGNSRLYAISSKGTNAAAAPAGTANPDAGAYLAGWPVKVPMLQTEALPTIGDGVAMPAVAGNLVPGADGPQVAVASATGTIMVFGADGTPSYGATADGAIPAVWAAGLGNVRADQFGANRNSDDLAASIVAFAGPAVGDLTGDGAHDIAVPTMGFSRLVDIQLNDLQLPNDDQVMAYDGATGMPLPGFPQAASDMAFFVQPSIGDIDGDGAAEVVAGNGVYTLNAFDASGASPSGWPKLTGGWTVGTPAIGDWDGDGTMEVAQLRRDGILHVWHTGSKTTPEWPSWNCDAANTGHNTGACSQAAVVPSTTTSLPTTTLPATTVPATTVPGTTVAGSTLPGDTTVPSDTTEPGDTTVPSDTTDPGDTTPPAESTAATSRPLQHGGHGPPNKGNHRGSSDTLAITGSRTTDLAILGAVLVAVGAVIESARRRRAAIR